MENRKPAAEIMKLSHCFEGRLHVQCGDFWKDLHNEIKVKFHTLPGNTASHECWYSSTQYQMTQHHMNVSTVPHSTRWHNVTWMSVQFHTVPDDTTSHECQYSSTHYQMTHHMNVGTVGVMVLKCFVLVLPIVWVKKVEYQDKYNTLHFCLHLQVDTKVMCEGIL